MSRSKVSSWARLSALLLAVVTAACGVDDGVGIDKEGGAIVRDTGTKVTVLLTDAAADYIAAANVDIGRVEILPAGDGGGPILLNEDGTEGYVNLLEFQGPATTPIAEAEIEPGVYGQLRLVVEGANVQLMAPYEFRGGGDEMDLFVPSGAQTGIKLNLRSEDYPNGIEIVPGETVIVLDFDVNQSFVLLGNPKTPAGVHGVNFKPTIRVTGMDVAASIAGTVFTNVDGLSIEGLTVVATPQDEGSAPGYQTETATALTDMDGVYKMWYMVPGTYEVTVDTDPGFATDPEAQTVELGWSENITDVDFELLDVRGSISGTVSTELMDVPVEGVMVTAQPEMEGIEPVMVATGPGGAYTMEDVVPGSYTVTIEVGEDQLSDPAEHMVEVGPNEDVVDVDFAIVEDLTGSISGTVGTDLEGVTVEGLTVTATPSAEGVDPIEATTNPDGTYTIDQVPAGTWTVTVDVGEGFATVPPSYEIELSEDEEVIDRDFQIVEVGSQ
ncbi:MAG: DUF4382 domain-containing protein [Longimicrobiales bacterium]|nr:DUF4382 domain-containing protein [Longimicrobiales bacterium]